ncbi:MAG TPA: hypothetical protein VF508_14150 [Pyrinomonadaceae bacterium]
MRDEDLTPFFNLDEHAVEAAIKTPEGAAVRAIKVILSLPVQEMAVGQGGEVAHLQPNFQCPTADLEGVRQRYIAVIEGTTYRVVRRENDGTGLSTVFMVKQ